MTTDEESGEFDAKPLMSNVENVRKWILALESGEFQQGRSRLNVNGRYCCLGVAVVVAQRAGVEISSPDWGHKASWHDLPEVEDFYGLPPQVGGCPTLLNEEGFVDAWWANDYMKWDFPTIAKALRRQYWPEEENA